MLANMLVLVSDQGPDGLTLFPLYAAGFPVLTQVTHGILQNLPFTKLVALGQKVIHRK